MTLPFLTLDSRIYKSAVWPGLAVRLRDDHVCIENENGGALKTLSTALWGGGSGEADRFVNLHVSKDYSSSEPERTVAETLARWNYRPDRTIGLMTAAWLTCASVQEEEHDSFRLVVCTTAAVGNAARAGVPRPVYSSYMAGTINIVVLVQGALSAQAEVEAVMVAAEAKAAAMQDMGVVDPKTGLIATGTTSDAIVLAYDPAYPQAGGIHRHAGTATRLGNAIGRLVHRSVCESAASKAMSHRAEHSRSSQEELT